MTKCVTEGCSKAAQHGRAGGKCRTCSEIQGANTDFLMAELERRGAIGLDQPADVECIDLSDGTWKEPVTVCELGDEEEQIPEEWDCECNLEMILYHVVGAMSDDDPKPRLKALAEAILEEL